MKLISFVSYSQLHSRIIARLQSHIDFLDLLALIPRSNCQTCQKWRTKQSQLSHLVGVFLLSLLACCSLLCVLIGATHCHSVFDGACEDINKLIPIGFWTILYCSASFLVTHLVQERAKSFGSFKFEQLWPPLKGLDRCFRTCNRNPFANRLLVSRQ